MSYTKQEFKRGETLYASELNEMDEQILKNAEDIKELQSKIPNKEALIREVIDALPAWQGGAF